MAGTYRLVRGMRDILPGVTGRWREVEAVVVDVLDRYGYTEIRLPLIEATELFSRGVRPGLHREWATAQPDAEAVVSRFDVPL